MMEKCELISANVCRTCLGEEGEFQSVFVSEHKSNLHSLQLSDMIKSCTSVEVLLGDGLPDHICTKCVMALVNMYNFKIQCINVDKVLRERLQKVNYHSQEFKCEASESSVKVELLDKTDYQDDVIINNFETFNLELPKDTSDASTNETVQDKAKNDVNNSEAAESQNHSVFGDFSNFDDSDNEVSAEEVSTTPEKPKQIKDKKFECEICQKKFSRNDLLLRHKIVHAMKMEHQISEQMQYLDNKNGLMLSHVQLKDEQYMYPCLKCDVAFEEKEELKRHMVKNHGEKQQVTSPCEVCGKKFSTLSHKKRHLRTTHFKDKHYRCPTCDKTFSRKEQFNHHMNGHSGLKPHICDICFKGFNQISNLKDHMRTHNGEKPFLCSTCGKGFNQLGNLRQHTIRHSGVKAHVCSTCGNGFASKGELSAHLRKHTGARPFVCSICNHGFTTSSSLTKHKRIHSGEKPYECDTCKMKFSRSGILARHKRTHTGEKPYICNFCSKAFSQSNDLTSHLRIHTGEKPYICDQCGQAFRQSSALKTHKKTHIQKSRIVLNDTINGFLPSFL